MNLDSFYGAFSSATQAINNIGQSLASLAKTASASPTILTTTAVTSIPVLRVADYPTGAQPYAVSSGNVAAATATATIPSSGGIQAYILGFIITSSGSTAASVVSPTLTGLTGGTLTFTYASLAGATVLNPQLIVSFPKALPASGTGVSISVSMPSLGAGNTNASIVAYGYRI